MTLLDTLRAAIEGLLAYRARSALTALGIVIGVAAVVAMVAVGEGARAQVTAALAQIGEHMLIVGNGSRTATGQQVGRGNVARLTDGDAEAIRREIPRVAIVAPSVKVNAHVVAGNRNWATQVHGVGPDWFAAHAWSLGTGRWFTTSEERQAAKVALLGSTVAEALFGGAAPPGASVRIGGVPFIVVGSLRSKGATPWGRDLDDLVVVPLSTGRARLIGNLGHRRDLLGEITVRATDAAAVAPVGDALNTLLRHRHRLLEGDPDDFTVHNIAAAAEARTASARTLTNLLAATAAIAMLVGGVGIMNTMLVSVGARTREIGLRLAVGATPQDLQRQFVIESMLLTVAGGIVGILLGITAAMILATVAEWPVRVTPWSLTLALASAALVGLFFGWYPARRAAALDPIIALRNE